MRVRQVNEKRSKDTGAGVREVTTGLPAGTPNTLWIRLQASGKGFRLKDDKKMRLEKRDTKLLWEQDCEVNVGLAEQDNCKDNAGLVIQDCSKGSIGTTTCYTLSEGGVTVG